MCAWGAGGGGRGVFWTERAEAEITSSRHTAISSKRREERRRGGDERGKATGGRESVFPVFLDGEAPFPGEMVVFVVIGELGFDSVGAAGQHPFWRLLNGGDVLVLLLWSGAVAPNHVLCFVNCGFEMRRKQTNKQKNCFRCGKFNSSQRCNKSRLKRNGETKVCWSHPSLLSSKMFEGISDLRRSPC